MHYDRKHPGPSIPDWDRPLFRIFVVTPDRTMPVEPGFILRSLDQAEAIAASMTELAKRNGWNLSYKVA